MPIPPQIPPGFDFKDDSTLRRVLDGLPMAVAISTPEIDGEMKFLNKAFLQTFGYSAEEIPNVQAWAERAYPDTAYRKQVFDEWNAEVARATREGGALVPMEFHVTCKDGSLRDVLFSAQAYDDMLVVSLFDITSRNQDARDLEAARAELEKTAFELTENIPAGTYTMVLPPDGGMGRFSFMSTRFLELCGLDRAAAEQNPFNAFACVHPDDYDEWVRKNAECFEQKIPFSEECRIVVNGKTRWIHAESIPRQRPDGTMIWEGVLSDITERKNAEAELASEEARLRKILDNIPVPVALNDARKDGRITFLNEAFTRTFGYTREDLPDVGVWAQLAYPDEAYRTATFRMWDAAVADAARTNGVVQPMEFRARAKDDTYRDVIISAAVFDDLLFVGFVDITERRKAETALRSAREQLQRSAYELTANIPVGTYVLEFDVEGRPNFTFSSERWLAMLGLRREEIINNPSLAFDAVHPEERAEFQRLNAEVFMEKKPFFWEGRIVVSGRISWVTIESIPRDRPDGGTIWEGVMTDITRRKEAEQQLAAAREREKRAEERERARLERKLKSSLTASAVAHEINQPLSSILLQSRLALEEAANEHPALIKIASEAQLVVRTIEKMKVLLRNVQTKHKNLNLSAVVKSSILQVEQQLAQHQILVHEEGTEKVHRMRGDEGQLQLAITNLLRNAIEAIEQAGTPHRHIHIAINPKRTMLELIIADSGPGFTKGIPAETPLNSTKLQGSGIGLYVVRTAMRNHDAKINFARSPLGGAEIRLRFPKSVGRKS